MRNKFLLWSLALALCLPTISAFAEFKLPPKKQKREVPGEFKPGSKAKQPPKPSGERPPPCREGLVYNHLMCPDNRTIQARMVCRNGRIVRENVIEEAACPAVPEEQPAQQEQPAQEQPANTTTLNGCALLDQSGMTYVLQDNLHVTTETLLSPDRRVCFEFRGPPPDYAIPQNVTLDCQGYSIIFDGARGGAAIGTHSQSTVRNCTIENFITGIGLGNNNNSFINNIVRYNTVGLRSSVDVDPDYRGPARYHLEGNIVCSNFEKDVSCYDSRYRPEVHHRDLFTGSNNQVTTFRDCFGNEGVPAGFFRPCDE